MVISQIIKAKDPVKRNNPTKTHRDQSSFMQLGAKIVELPELIKNQHNVQEVIKNMARTIRALYNRSQEEERIRIEKPKPTAPTMSQVIQSAMSSTCGQVKECEIKKRRL